MTGKLNYELSSLNNVLVSKEELDFLDENNILSFFDEYGKHYIDYKNLEYKKINDEYEFIIDFKKKVCLIKLSGQQDCSMVIDCSFNSIGNNIVFTYTIEDEITMTIYR